MTKEELLSMLQERGMSDDEIKMVLQEALDTLGKDFEEHDEDEAQKASELLGVELKGE